MEVSDSETEDGELCRKRLYRHLELHRYHPHWNQPSESCRYSLHMVYIKTWNEYQTKAEQLYTEHPTRVRLRIIRYASRLIQECLSPVLLHLKDPILRKIPSSTGNTGAESDGRQHGWFAFAISYFAFTNSSLVFPFRCQCLKFKTKSSIILNRFEALNLSLMAKMQNRRKTPPPPPMPSFPSTPASAAVVGSASGTPRAGTPAAQMEVDGPAPGTSSGPAKKKPKKKKK